MLSNLLVIIPGFVCLFFSRDKKKKCGAAYLSRPLIGVALKAKGHSK